MRHIAHLVTWKPECNLLHCKAKSEVGYLVLNSLQERGDILTILLNRMEVTDTAHVLEFINRITYQHRPFWGPTFQNPLQAKTDERARIVPILVKRQLQTLLAKYIYKRMGGTMAYWHLNYWQVTQGRHHITII